MRPVGTLAILVTCLVACSKPVPGDTNSHPPDPPPHDEKATTMTDFDPTSPTAWQQAEAIAATAAKGTLEKRSDALPFMFMADDPAAVLVHKGRVVREKGGKVAGEYLRDLGIIEGKGPKIEDVLFVLFALDAWPPIKEVPKEAYVHAPDNPAQADVTAQVDFDGVTAHVTLVYFLGEPALPQHGSGAGNIGGMDPDFKPKLVRPAARCTLTIPKTGDPAWKIEKLNIGG